jgi:hypothetical protein
MHASTRATSSRSERRIMVKRRREEGSGREERSAERTAKTVQHATERNEGAMSMVAN